MKFLTLHKQIILNSLKTFQNPIVILLISLSILFLPGQSFALNETDGENLFIKHCSGCHINGGNIIRRNKTLKLKDLQRNGLDNPEEISKIAREGVGIMSGYQEVLGEGGDELVANWIWKQSQKAWVQG